MINAKTVRVGDRVVRDGRTVNDALRRGTLARIYASMPNGLGHTVPLFAVTWDDTESTESGYLENNLALEPTSVGVMRNR